MKVIAFDINEIWSVDLAYMDKLAKYNDGVKYLMIAVDVLSRYLRVEKLKTKQATETSTALKRMIKSKQPQKLWVDKGTEFKSSFSQLCQRKGIEIYNTESDTKSAFAERNIRSLKNIIYKHLELKWSYRYVDKLDFFVNIINGRKNRVTKLAPKEVTKRHVPYLISLNAEKSSRLQRTPRFRIGDYVRIAKPDLPFRKGYKQSFTDEVFEISSISTVNPPTYQLIDANKETIKGKFYEPELNQVDVLELSNGE